MHSELDPSGIAEDMSHVIVALTRDLGACSRLDLGKAGFTTQEIGDYYALASAIASLVMHRHPKNH